MIGRDRREWVAWAAPVALVAGGLGLGLGCGDNGGGAPIVTAISGDRLAVTWMGYDDGARHAQAGQLYDRREQAMCVPFRWGDGVIRCVPRAEPAIFVDADCTQVVGRAQAIDRPTHFIGYERIDNELIPTRLYRAGRAVATARFYWERRDGVCVGPFNTQDTSVDHAVTAEVDGGGLVAMGEDEIGDGRLVVTIATAADGARMPTGVRDRQLDLRCTPTVRPDGQVGCDPIATTPTSWFADPQCRAPVAVVADTAPVPPVTSVIDRDGCADYYRVAAEVTGPLYRKLGDACGPATPPARSRAYDAATAIELGTLARASEDVAGQRLQRIVLDAGGIRFYDQRLLDSATAADCAPVELDDRARCLPTALATGTTLFGSAACTFAVPVVELPQPTCGRPAFALTVGTRELRAIGDPLLVPLYQRAPDASCAPYQPPSGSVVRALGPALAPTAFVGGVLYGERP